MTGNFFSHQVQILHYKLDQYANFHCPGIIGSILECGLFLTLPFLPMPLAHACYKDKEKDTGECFITLMPVTLSFLIFGTRKSSDNGGHFHGKEH